MTILVQKWNPVSEQWENIDPTVHETGCGDQLRVIVEAEACQLGAELLKASTDAPCEQCGLFAFYPTAHTCGE